MSKTEPTREPLIGRPRWTADNNDQWVRLGGGLIMPLVVNVTNLTDDEWDYYVDADVFFDTESMRYEITSVTLHSYRLNGRPTPVTAKSLRSLLINKLEAKIFDTGFPILVDNESRHAPGEPVSIGLTAAAELVRGNGPTPEALQVAAVIYCAFYAIRGNPTQMISRYMDLPHRTASHWVKLARERGYLSTDPTKSIDEPKGWMADSTRD